MNTWTKQKGYPVVSIKIKNQKLAFKQSQFFSSGSLGDGQQIVPITFGFGSYDKKESFLLQTKFETHNVKEFSSDNNKSGITHSQIKLNVDQTGFYQVKYNEELAVILHFVIENKYLTTTDRFGILNYSSALGMAHQLPLTFLITLMSAYKEEIKYNVLSKLITIA